MAQKIEMMYLDDQGKIATPAVLAQIDARAQAQIDSSGALRVQDGTLDLNGVIVTGFSESSVSTTTLTDKNMNGSTIGGANGWWATPGAKGSYAAVGDVATATATVDGTSTDLFGLNQSLPQPIPAGAYSRFWAYLDIRASFGSQAIVYLMFTKAGAALSTANNTVKYPITPGVWQSVAFNVAVPADADGVKIFAQAYGPWTTGATFEAKNAGVITSDRGYFNGSTLNTTTASEDRTHVWDGTANGSTSTRTITTRTTSSGLPAGETLTGAIIKASDGLAATSAELDAVTARVAALEATPAPTTTIVAAQPGPVTSGRLAPARIVALGDSLTSPDGGAPTGQGWVEDMKNGSYGRAFVVKNAGIPGNNTSQMLARFESDVAAFSPQYVTFMGGTNDITQAVPLATMQANVQAIFDKVKALGAQMVIMSIPPRDLADRKLAETASWNAWVKKFATDNGLLFIDFHRTLVDPATGGYKAGLGNADQLHFSRLGAATLGDLMLREFVSTLPAAQVVPPSNNVDPTNLLTNPLFLSGTDTAPTGWTVGTTPAGVARTRVDDPAFPGGKAWETKIDKSTTADVSTTLSQNTANSWTAGDKLRFQVQFAIVSSDPLPESGTDPRSQKGFGLSALFYGAPSGAVQSITKYQSLAGLDGIAWADLVVPDGTTGPVQWSASISAPAGYGLTVRLGAASVRNLTALGL